MSEGKITRIDQPLVDYLRSSIKLIARSGSTNFTRLIRDVLVYHGWERKQDNETSHDIIQRIERYKEDSPHTIAPLMKRLVSLGTTEHLQVLGNNCLYFLSCMTSHEDVLNSTEALDFVNILYPSCQSFERWNEQRSTEKLDSQLAGMSDQALQATLSSFNEPTQGSYSVEAAQLMSKAEAALEAGRINLVQELLAAFMIKYCDTDQSPQKAQLQDLSARCEKAAPGFEDQLMQLVAVRLYYEILAGIQKNLLTRTITGIRKYTIIFKGNPQARHFYAIDKLEKKLYSIIEQKNLWQPLEQETGV